MVKFLVMDVDGSLTDGKIYMGAEGEAFKSFNIKDGCGIKDIIPQHGIVPVIITARESKMLVNRCQELGIIDFHQNIRQKLDKLKEIISGYNLKDGTSYTLKDCAYFGDDILDIKCMDPIKKAGGIVGCPSDAVREIKTIADYVSLYKAGEGALRDFIAWLIEPRTDEEEISRRVNDAIGYLQKLKVAETDAGTKIIVNENFSYSIQCYRTKPIDECRLESHRKYIDVQIIVSGREAIDFADISRLMIKEEYSEDNDVMIWNAPSRMARVTLKAGDCIVLYPENAHRGAVSLKDSETVVKIVGKVKIS